MGIAHGSRFLLFSFFVAGLFAFVLCAQPPAFHGAPESAGEIINPLSGQAAAAAEGAKLYSSSCSSCHGTHGEGQANIPGLAKSNVRSAKPGEVFWYISKGDTANGMPGWSSLAEKARWQIVTYLQSPDFGTAAAAATSRASHTPILANLPPPRPPFIDYRYETPGTIHHIRVGDLPAPNESESAANGPKIVPRPENAWPKAPAGFKVQLYATGLHNPRLMRAAPNGDVFLAETAAGDIRVFRGIDASGKPQRSEVFASGLNTPFGIAFYPSGPDPHWVYVADMDAVVRFPYHSGDLVASGRPEHLIDLPSGGHHRSRDVQFSADGKKMLVSVGSHENVSDADFEKDRADILEFNPDGTGKQTFAWGIRNAVGIAIQPGTGDLWCSVNERDGLGNDLVPDYITRVERGSFYGWPWWYMGGHQDPRFPGAHSELKEKVRTPDVILQPHQASLQMIFYEGKQFPAGYTGDIFAAEHGSWNRQPRAGYEVIRIPLHQSSRASGEFEDFLTGFVVDDESVWGRPVGVAVAPDGSLLVSDDASGSIWRVSYVGK